MTNEQLLHAKARCLQLHSINVQLYYNEQSVKADNEATTFSHSPTSFVYFKIAYSPFLVILRNNRM